MCLRLLKLTPLDHRLLQYCTVFSFTGLHVGTEQYGVILYWATGFYPTVWCSPFMDYGLVHYSMMFSTRPQVGTAQYSTVYFFTVLFSPSQDLSLV